MTVTRAGDPFPDDFRDLFDAFHRAGVEFLVVGAYALARHGYVRATLDLDVFVMRGNQRLGFEMKRTSTPRVTRSMRVALDDLKLDRLDIVYAGNETFPLADRVRAVPAARLFDDVEPLA